ncbi:MAG TPA: DUF3187 family protein [Steroidobacteraceae bacterium]
MVICNRRSFMGAARPLAAALAFTFAATVTLAQDAEDIVDGAITERVLENGTPREAPQRWSHTGLLRGRDLSPFGLLRLDMLPAHTADAEAGTWAFEILYSYQNTFVMSENVRDYLGQRNIGRQPLRPEDAAALLALPGDAYYVDGEVGYADLIVQHRINDYWSVYLTMPYIHYGSGMLDSTIESFHDTFGFSQQGRDLVARNQFQIVYGIGDVRFAMLDRDTEGGFGDPVLGIRYSLPEPRFGWDVVVELAAKFAIEGERFLLSTGRHDYGAQITLQRRLGETGRHAVYLSGSGVYYAGGPEIPGDKSELIPTLIVGYSYGLTPTTSVILQGYASESVIQKTTLEELKEEKYQLSLGVQSRGKNILWSLAVTENVSNFNNTPDIGVQAGIAYMPRAK